MVFTAYPQDETEAIVHPRDGKVAAVIAEV
jgi:hypothetical protein